MESTSLMPPPPGAVERDYGKMRAAVALLPRDAAFRYFALPLDVENGTMTVGIVSRDAADLAALEVKTRHKIASVLMDAAEIRSLLEELYPAARAQSLDERATRTAKETLDAILMKAVELHASDAHFEPTGEERGAVRLRVDGQLILVRELGPNEFRPVCEVLKTECGVDVSAEREYLDGNAEYTTQGGQTMDLRLSARPLDGLPQKIVARLLGNALTLRRITELGMPDDIRDRYLTTLAQPSHLHVVAGPTNTGKSTTLKSVIAHMIGYDPRIQDGAFRPKKNVLTIEDPVELRIPGVWHTSVSAKVSFEQALRGDLRQDPDIEMIGELRDSIAIDVCNNALTGTLMFASVHATDAIRAIGRILGFGVPQSTLSSALRSVLSQRLIKRLCPHCKRKRPIALGERNLFQAAKIPMPGEIADASPQGCEQCLNTGYSGRLGIFELLVISDELEDMINAGASRAMLEQIAAEQNYVPMRHNALDLITKLEVSIADAQSVVALSKAGI